ncbi:MAG: hypothetical protein Q9170_004601 [Blastenia crenularia]
MKFPFIHDNFGPENLSDFDCHLLVYINSSFTSTFTQSETTDILQHLDCICWCILSTAESGECTIIFEKPENKPHIDEADVKAAYTNITMPTHPQHAIYAYWKSFEHFYNNHGQEKFNGNMQSVEEGLQAPDADILEIALEAYKHLKFSKSKLNKIEFGPDDRIARIKSQYRKWRGLKDILSDIEASG